MIYSIGHKSPDLDSVAAAIALADLKNKIDGKNEYVPAVAGELNKETEFILEKFGFSAPEQLSTLSGQKVFLVDHNEESQRLDGFAEAEIVGVIDHHKINFKSERPIEFKNLPWGSFKQKNKIRKKFGRPDARRRFSGHGDHQIPDLHGNRQRNYRSIIQNSRH